MLTGNSAAQSSTHPNPHRSSFPSSSSTGHQHGSFSTTGSSPASVPGGGGAGSSGGPNFHQGGASGASASSSSQSEVDHCINSSISRLMEGFFGSGTSTVDDHGGFLTQPLDFTIATVLQADFPLNENWANEVQIGEDLIDDEEKLEYDPARPIQTSLNNKTPGARIISPPSGGSQSGGRVANGIPDVYPANATPPNTSPVDTGGGDMNTQMKRDGERKLLEAIRALNLPKDLQHHKSVVEQMDLSSLYHEKKRVKEKLKEFDEWFKLHYGQVPNRREKEPMRPLYTYYRLVKMILDTREKYNQRAGGGTARPANSSQQPSPSDDWTKMESDYGNSNHPNPNIRSSPGVAAVSPGGGAPSSSVQTQPQNHQQGNNAAIMHQQQQLHPPASSPSASSPSVGHPGGTSSFSPGTQSGYTAQQSPGYGHSPVFRVQDGQGSSQGDFSRTESALTQNVQSSPERGGSNIAANLQPPGARGSPPGTTSGGVTRLTPSGGVLTIGGSASSTGGAGGTTVQPGVQDHHTPTSSHFREVYPMRSPESHLREQRDPGGSRDRQQREQREQTTLRHAHEYNELQRKHEELQRQKAVIRDKLQKYQDDFLTQNHRKIKYHKDILPIEKDYQKYKEIKKKLLETEQAFRDLQNTGYGTVEPVPHAQDLHGSQQLEPLPAGGAAGAGRTVPGSVQQAIGATQARGGGAGGQLGNQHHAVAPNFTNWEQRGAGINANTNNFLEQQHRAANQQLVARPRGIGDIVQDRDRRHRDNPNEG
ncbi:unnamed protein product [Amoebophrya sp. A120]|nr:unnamed protein product [Amoebophrya sp. A120]|eukprot:GSA120T00014169001.1